MSFVFTKLRIPLKTNQSVERHLKDGAHRERLNENPANEDVAAADKNASRRLRVDTWDIHGAF